MGNAPSTEELEPGNPTLYSDNRQSENRERPPTQATGSVQESRVRTRSSMGTLAPKNSAEYWQTSRYGSSSVSPPPKKRQRREEHQGIEVLAEYPRTSLEREAPANDTNAPHIYEYAQVPKGPKNSTATLPGGSNSDNHDEPTLGDLSSPHILIPANFLKPHRTMVRHLSNYLWKTSLRPRVKINQNGYYLLFPDTKHGEDDLLELYHLCNGQLLFSEYELHMEIYPKDLRPRGSMAPGTRTKSSGWSDKPTNLDKLRFDPILQRPTNTSPPIHVPGQDIQTPQTTTLERPNRRPTNGSDRLSHKFRRTSEPDVVANGDHSITVSQPLDTAPKLATTSESTTSQGFGDQSPPPGNGHPVAPADSPDDNISLRSHRISSAFGHSQFRRDDDLTSNKSLTPSEASSTAIRKLEKLCYACEQPENALNSFQQCASCWRRFHETCRIPMPASAQEGVKWHCKHCIKRKRHLETVGAEQSPSSPLNLPQRPSWNQFPEHTPERDPPDHGFSLSYTNGHTREGASIPALDRVAIEASAADRRTAKMSSQSRNPQDLSHPFADKDINPGVPIQVDVEPKERSLPLSAAEESDVSMSMSVSPTAATLEEAGSPPTENSGDGHVNSADQDRERLHNDKRPEDPLGRSVLMDAPSTTIQSAVSELPPQDPTTKLVDDALNVPKSPPHVVSPSTRSPLQTCTICKKKKIYSIGKNATCRRCRDAEATSAEEGASSNTPARQAVDRERPHTPVSATQSPEARTNKVGVVYTSNPLLSRSQTNHTGSKIAKRAPSTSWMSAGRSRRASTTIESGRTSSIDKIRNDDPSSNSRSKGPTIQVLNPDTVILNADGIEDDVGREPGIFKDPLESNVAASNSPQGLGDATVSGLGNERHHELLDAQNTSVPTLSKPTRDSLPQKSSMPSDTSINGGQVSQSDPEDAQAPGRAVPSASSVEGSDTSAGAQEVPFAAHVLNTTLRSEDTSQATSGAEAGPHRIPPVNRGVMATPNPIETTASPTGPPRTAKPATLLELAAWAIATSPNERVSSKQAVERIIAQEFARYNTHRREWQGGVKAKLSGHFKRDMARADDNGLAHYTFAPGQRRHFEHLFPGATGASTFDPQHNATVERLPSRRPSDRTVRRLRDESSAFQASPSSAGGMSQRKTSTRSSTVDTKDTTGASSATSSRQQFERTSISDTTGRGRRKRLRKYSPKEGDGDEAMYEAAGGISEGIAHPDMPAYQAPKIDRRHDRDKYGYSFDLSDIEDPFNDELQLDSAIDYRYEHLLNNPRFTRYDYTDVFTLLPDLHPNNHFDADIKRSEIKTRPTRGELKRMKKSGKNVPKPPLLVDRRKHESKQHTASSSGEEGTKPDDLYDPDLMVTTPTRLSSLPDEEPNWRQVHSIEEVFKMPKFTIPIIDRDGDLAFRDGTRVNGVLPRARHTWKVGQLEEKGQKRH